MTLALVEAHGVDARQHTLILITARILSRHVIWFTNARSGGCYAERGIRRSKEGPRCAIAEAAIRQRNKGKLQRLLIEYLDARMFLANKVRNPNFKKADFDIVLKKLGLK
jgi:hypothetical protein